MKSLILMAAMYALTISASAATKIDLDGPGWTFRTTLDVKPDLFVGRNDSLLDGCEDFS